MLVLNVEVKAAKFINDKTSAFIKFAYNKEAIEKIKTIEGRRFVPDEKCWEIPRNKLNDLEKIFIDDRILYKNEDTIKFPVGYDFKTEPLPHQKEGIVFGLNHNKYLLADEQGLGKTYQALHVAAIRKYLYRDRYTLIICGINTLKKNWYNEVKEHTYESAYILGTRYTRKGTLKEIKSVDKLEDLHHLNEIDSYFIITNIESFQDEEFSKKVKVLCKQNIISTILFDEVHCCKNPTTLAAQNLIGVESKNIICMTGTPIINNPLDVYISLCLLGLEARVFPHFKNHYTITSKIRIKGKTKPVNIVVGYQKLEEIQQKIENHYLRRRKEDVLNLPDKIHKTEYLEMLPKQRKLYNEVVNDILKDTSIKTLDNALAKFTRLRQITSAPTLISEIGESIKLIRMRQIVSDRVANNRKVIVFTNWAEVAKIAYSELIPYHPALMVGETKDRDSEIHKFKTDDDCMVIIGTLKLLGTGFTLTEADTVIFLDSPWTAALKAQAEDRTHRIGTKHTVNIITLVCESTVDERVEEIVSKKVEMTDIMLEFKSVGKFVNFMLT